MGGEEIKQLQEENSQLMATVTELRSLLHQCESDKLQLQSSYEESLQSLADSEAKRETVERELRLAHDQISSMWKELESLHRKLDGPNPQLPSGLSLVNEGSLELQCTLCKEKIKPSNCDTPLATGSPSLTPRPSLAPHSSPSTLPKASPKTSPRSQRKGWLTFGKRQRVHDLEAHSKVCSISPSESPKTVKKVHSSPRLSSESSRKLLVQPLTNGISAGEHLVVNVTRTSPGTTDLAPFKVVTKSNMSQFSQTLVEVHRSQGDFQWLYEALQEACPERIVPPLKPPISLDATMSEFQRFLSRIAVHKSLRKHHLFVIFLTGSAEEVRSLRAKHRPRRPNELVQYRPAVGRDNSGPLVITKEYLSVLEQNILGLANHLESVSRRKTALEKTGHWFRAISESEPMGTYLKSAAGDLARTCEAMETQPHDSDETLLIHNLQSLADLVRASQQLLSRVEDAVDKFLYWDEEVSIIEAVTSSPVTDSCPTLEAAVSTEDIVFDDSGVSDITSSSNNSAPPTHSSGDRGSTGSSGTGTSSVGVSMSEKWAQASKYCADAKDYLEMMCHNLAEELAQFDLQKEKELKQILMDYSSAQLERHEKFQGKWFAMKYLLDAEIHPLNRAIQFSSVAGTDSQGKGQ